MAVKAMLDTSVLVGRMPDRVIDEIESYAASFIVRAELLRGLRRFEQTPGREQEALVRRQRISTLDSLHGFWRIFDAAASEACAALRSAPETAVRTKDALIAAHALALEVPLVTADRGFTRFADVEIEFV